MDGGPKLPRSQWSSGSDSTEGSISFVLNPHSSPSICWPWATRFNFVYEACSLRAIWQRSLRSRAHREPRIRFAVVGQSVFPWPGDRLLEAVDPNRLPRDRFRQRSRNKIRAIGERGARFPSSTRGLPRDDTRPRRVYARRTILGSLASSVDRSQSGRVAHG